MAPVGKQLQRCRFTSLALRNLKFEEKASTITKRRLTQNGEKQPGAWDPSPPHAGYLKALLAEVREEVARETLVADAKPNTSATSTPPGRAIWGRRNRKLRRMVSEEGLQMEVVNLGRGPPIG
jgi:hypothetical protein